MEQPADLMVGEQLLNTFPVNVKIWVEEGRPKTSTVGRQLPPGTQAGDTTIQAGDATIQADRGQDTHGTSEYKAVLDLSAAGSFC